MAKCIFINIQANKYVRKYVIHILRKRFNNAYAMYTHERNLLTMKHANIIIQIFARAPIHISHTFTDY